MEFPNSEKVQTKTLIWAPKVRGKGATSETTKDVFFVGIYTGTPRSLPNIYHVLVNGNTHLYTTKDIIKREEIQPETLLAAIGRWGALGLIEDLQKVVDLQAELRVLYDIPGQEEEKSNASELVITELPEVHEKIAAVSDPRKQQLLLRRSSPQTLVNAASKKKRKAPTRRESQAVRKTWAESVPVFKRKKRRGGMRVASKKTW